MPMFIRNVSDLAASVAVSGRGCKLMLVFACGARVKSALEYRLSLRLLLATVLRAGGQ